MSTNIQKLLNDGKAKFGSYAEFCRRAKVNKCTAWRHLNQTGTPTKPHLGTLAKLLRALDEAPRAH